MRPSVLLRSLFGRTRLSSAVAIISVAFGLSAATAAISLAEEIWFRSLHVQDPSRLVVLSQKFPGMPPYEEFSLAKYRQVAGLRQAFSSVGAYAFQSAYVSTDPSESGSPLLVAAVTRSYFETVGVMPMRGRMFSAEEETVPDAHPVAIISFRYWRDRLGNASNAVGRTLGINGSRFSIIGILPSGFAGTEITSSPDIWVPVTMAKRVITVPDPLRRAAGTADPLRIDGYSWLRTIALLAPGVPAAAAQAQVAAALNESGSQAMNTASVSVLPLRIARLPAELRGMITGIVGLFVALALLSVLTGSANAGSILVQRHLERRGELAIRAALGATRVHLAKAALVEAFSLYLPGAVIAVLSAAWLRDAFAGLVPALGNRAERLFPLSPVVLCAVLVLTTAAAVASAAGTMLRLWRSDLSSDLRAAGCASGGASRYQRVMVVGQVGLAVVLSIWASLLMRSLYMLEGAPTGYSHSRDLLFARVNVVGPEGARPGALQSLDSATAAVSSIPGVVSCSLTRSSPFSDGALSGMPGYKSRPDNSVQIEYNLAGPEYFRTVGIPLLRGREFRSTDNSDAPPVVIVNETLARLIWPGRTPIGQLDLGREVVGLARDAMLRNPWEAPPPVMYIPFAQMSEPTATLVIRAGIEPHAIIKTIRQRLSDANPALRIGPIETMEDRLRLALWRLRTIAFMAGFMAVVTLILAAIGVYAVTAHSVQERTPEIGIRMALGGDRGSILKMIESQILRCAVAGCLIGCAVALTTQRVISTFLYGVAASDPRIILGACAGTVALVCVAAFWPSVRAASIAPATALRNE